MRRLICALLLVLAPALAGAQILTLETCIERALGDNTDLRLAAQGVERATADVKTARANRLPSADATLFGYTRSRTGPSVRTQENPTGQVDPATGQRIFQEEETLIPAINRNSFAFSASVNQTLWDGGRLKKAHQAAHSDLQGAEKSLQSRRVEVAAQVKRRYYDLLKAKELVEVQQEALKLSDQQLQDAQTRLEVGSGTEVDVLRLGVARDNALTQLINAEQSVTLGRANLNHIMGSQVRAPIDVAPLQQDWSRSVPNDFATLLERALGSSPELERLRLAVWAADLGLAGTRGAWHPRLTGSASYSRNNEEIDRVYGDIDQNYRLDLRATLSYNIFDGGIRRANTARARTGLENARLAVEQEERSITLALETAQLELTRLEKIYQVSQRTVHLAQEDLRLAEERYRVGKGRLLEVLDAQVGFIQGRSNLVQTRYDLEIAEAELERLMGSW
ncbi:MAG: hypothetical protein GKR89_03030 [Candidatus Latescibacteria bacterium]|nr:hypothetical protein [Candidatus Latescibacterota bacterium]